MEQKLYREQDLKKLGFTFLYENYEKNWLPILCSNSNISINGNIDVHVNLRLNEDFHCTGFIRAMNIVSLSSLTVDNFISCDNLTVKKDLLVNNFLVAKNVNCNGNVVVMNRIDVATINANSITANGSVDALDIKAKNIAFLNSVSAKSIVIK